MVLAFHIGTDPVDMTVGGAAGGAGQVYRGPGGAVMNYTETTFSGQRAAMKMVASGALDRHPEPQGADLRGRRDVGAVPRRPDAGGLPAAPHGGSAQADPQTPRRSC